MQVRLAAAAVACGYSVACGGGAAPDVTPPGRPARFREIPPDASGLVFANPLAPTEHLNIITYLYYYNGGGIAAGDVNADGLPDLYFAANQGPDALYLNEGGLRFRDVTEEAGLSRAADWSTGVSFADVDGDGDLDLYVNKATGHADLPGAHNELYLNDGAGHFSEASAKLGLDLAGLSTQTAFFDADADGDLDAYALRQSVHDTERYSAGAQRSRRSSLYGDRLLLQGDDGRFRDASAEAGVYGSRLGYGLGVSVADFDGDGAIDVYVGNDFTEHDYLYLGLGDGRFRESGAAAFESTSKFSMGSAAGDLDGDGRLDLVSLDMRPSLDSVRKSSSGAEAPAAFASRLRQGFRAQYARNAVQLNVGTGFTDVAPMLGLHSTDWSWAPVLFDPDLDGDLDVFVANGIPRRPNDLDYLKYGGGAAVQRAATNLELAELMPPGLAVNRSFAQVANFSFADADPAWGLEFAGATTAAIAVDLDGDRDPDVVTSDVDGRARVFENLTRDSIATAPENVLTVELSGPRGNPYGVGAQVRVRAVDFERVIPVEPVTGFQSSVIAPLLVALPAGQRAADALVEVDWLDGTVTRSLSGGALRSIAHAEGEAAANRPAGWRDERPSVSALQDYGPFDRQPLSPLVAPQRTEAADSLLRTWSAEGLPSAVTQRIAAHNVLDARVIGDTLYLAGWWSPVTRVWRRPDSTLAARPLTASGLWSRIVPLADGSVLLGNLGTNTLLTERSGVPVLLYEADYDGNGAVDSVIVRGEGPEASTLFGLDVLSRQMPVMRKFFTKYLPFSASRFDDLFGGMLAHEGATVSRADELKSVRYQPASGEVTALPAPFQRGALGDATLRGDSVYAEMLPLVGHPEVGAPSRRVIGRPLRDL